MGAYAEQLAAILFHMMSSVSNFALPNYGSHYDPAIAFIMQWGIAVVIVFLWGAATLDQYRFTRPPRMIPE